MTEPLKRVEAFAGLSPAALEGLEAAAETRALKGGDLLVRYGEEADALYIVTAGRFQVQLPDGRIVAEIEAGEPVGELAFFSGGTRTADVRATRDGEVFGLTRAAYESVVAGHPEITQSILAAVARRLAATTASARAMEAKPGRVIALLPAGSAPIPESFAERLVKSLAKCDAPRLVREADMPAGLAPEDAGFGRWIAELEHSAGRVLLRASDNDSWNRAIARNADDLLLIAPLAGDNPALSELETYALPIFQPANRMLVLWRERQAQDIAGAGAWLEGRHVKLHHHVPLDSGSAFDRVARFMAGRANGVVLAGGGALGCAHIGVMQALIENGIPIDYYGGTSAGAAMAGALAQGLTAEETLDQMHEMFIANKAMKRVTIPVHSLLDPRVFDAQLRARYGTKDIADLPYNFFGVSTNLSTNGIFVHTRGPLWEAVRASGSLPTILPPLITAQGDILIDGGVLDNIPVRIMRELKAGPNVVVALRADAGARWQVDATYDDVRSPGQLARDILLRRKPARSFPSLVEIMSRSMVVASEGSVEASLAQADALLVPPIPEGMQILDWHLGKALSEAARVHTAEAIAARADLAAMKAA
ncbi:MAG: cyclic nucleotide-binding and patatin-like phospholipase domain-containing protein [Erythrobacter sp.]|jgi:NTE family protein|nr:cyclic nucleotide-binding and patatin-like phospholipase domain-containing protein [Erythrobacter sp.]